MTATEVEAVKRLRTACTAYLVAAEQADDEHADQVDHDLVRPLADILRREARHVERLLGVAAAGAAGRPS